MGSYIPVGGAHDGLLGCNHRGKKSCIIDWRLDIYFQDGVCLVRASPERGMHQPGVI